MSRIVIIAVLAASGWLAANRSAAAVLNAHQTHATKVATATNNVRGM